MAVVLRRSFSFPAIAPVVVFAAAVPFGILFETLDERDGDGPRVQEAAEIAPRANLLVEISTPRLSEIGDRTQLYLFLRIFLAEF